MRILGNNWDYLIFAIIVFIVAFIVGRVLRYLIGRGVQGASVKLKVVDPTKYNFLKNAVEFIVYIIAVIVIFKSIPQLKDYGTAIFAGAGVFAAIVGLASQSAFSNIVSGIFIVIFKPFSVGDRVRVGQLYTGDVEDITLRHTIIKDFENRRIVIPNTIISNETIVNSTLTDETLCVFVELNITLSSDIDKAMRIMQDECLKHPLCIDNRTAAEKSNDFPQVNVRLIEFNDYGQRLRAYAWAKNPSDGFDLKCDVLKSIKLRFDREGVEVAVPQRTVTVRENAFDHKHE